MSVYQRREMRSETPNVPTLGQSMMQGKKAGTNTARPNPDDITASMKQGSRKGGNSSKMSLGGTMKQSSNKKK